MHPGCHENVHAHRWSVLRDDVCSERVLNDVLVVSKDGEAIQTLNLGNNSIEAEAGAKCVAAVLPECK